MKLAVCLLGSALAFSANASFGFNGMCEEVGDAIEATFCTKTILDSLSVESCEDSAEKAVRLFHSMPTSWAYKNLLIRNIKLVKSEGNKHIYNVEYAYDPTPFETYYGSVFMNVKVAEDLNSCGALDVEDLSGVR